MRIPEYRNAALLIVGKALFDAITIIKQLLNVVEHAFAKRQAQYTKAKADLLAEEGKGLYNLTRLPTRLESCTRRISVGHDAARDELRDTELKDFADLDTDGTIKWLHTVKAAEKILEEGGFQL
ncbi:MAG: hypothetical protein Q9201_001537 [Fulgogasparrea decipioides]